jgi:SAM-dependent methyltransferase
MPQHRLYASNHYLAQAGEHYFRTKFGSDMEDGRIFQSRYFLPFCNDQIKLLDFGCADGAFLRHLPAQEKIGVEANPAARATCQKICDASRKRIQLHDSLETIQSNYVDVVISNHCLEHVLDPYHVMTNIWRVLKPKGLFALMVPFDDYRSSKNKTWVADDLDYHLYTWSPMNLGNLLSESGFKVQRISLHTRAWSPKMLWINRLFGEQIFKISCYILGYYKSRREVFAVSTKE